MQEVARPAPLPTPPRAAAAPTTAATALDSGGSAASEKGAAAEFTAAAAEAKVAARAEEEAGAAGVSACSLHSPRRSLRRSLAALLTLISVCVRCTSEIWLVLDPRVTAIWPSSAAFSGAASANSKGKRVIVIKERWDLVLANLPRGWYSTPGQSFPRATSEIG